MKPTVRLDIMMTKGLSLMAATMATALVNARAPKKTDDTTAPIKSYVKFINVD